MNEEWLSIIVVTLLICGCAEYCNDEYLDIFKIWLTTKDI